MEDEDISSIGDIEIPSKKFITLFNNYKQPLIKTLVGFFKRIFNQTEYI